MPVAMIPVSQTCATGSLKHVVEAIQGRRPFRRPSPATRLPFRARCKVGWKGQVIAPIFHAPNSATTELPERVRRRQIAAAIACALTPIAASAGQNATLSAFSSRVSGGEQPPPLNDSAGRSGRDASPPPRDRPSISVPIRI